MDKVMFARILIVDDYTPSCDALRLFLSRQNPEWQFFTAANELEGVEVIQRQVVSGEPIDLVLTDLVMGSDDSGMTMLQAARKLDPSIMAILFTAKEKSLDRYAAYDYGAFDVVEKNMLGATAAREINIKATAALRYRERSQQIAFMRRYFDPRVFESIEKSKSILALKQRRVTIAFWDIRGFSRLCEILKEHPELIAEFLRQYCEDAARTIFEHNGILDKFIGDGIMALFGVLKDHRDEGTVDAIDAVRAALAIREKDRDFNI